MALRYQIFYRHHMEDVYKRQSNTMAGTDRLEITVCGREEQTLLTARFDNLGKGVAAAAIQNPNLMLGFPETTGLKVE